MLFLLPVISGGVNGNNFCHHSLSLLTNQLALIPRLTVPRESRFFPQSSWRLMAKRCTHWSDGLESLALWDPAARI